jgi:hypothetical protein
MPLTTQQFQAWLKDPRAVRCVLVEVDVKLAGGSNVTRYLSNRGYVTSPTDTPANTVYSPVISGGVKFSQSMSLDGGTTLSFGDLELNNVDGSLDSWLDDYWQNRAIKILIGDQTWARADFQQIFGGVVLSIETKSRKTLNINLSDKLQRLNTTVTDTKLGGSTTNADQTIPLCFGECHNIEPLLIDPTLMTYQVHNGPVERIIEVRDNGVPVTITTDLANGKFTLVNHPIGQITASVQGDKPSTYTNDVAGIVKRLVKDFGKSGQRFTDAELDLTSLTAFATANPQPVGIYVKDRENLLETCNELAKTVGARLVCSPAGLLSLVEIALPQATAGTTVTAADMADRTLEISTLPPVVASVKLGYDKNWTVQTSLASGLPDEHRTLFGEEYLTVTRSDTSTADNYLLYTDPDEEDTLLCVGADASNEAQRRLDLFKVQRKVFRFTGYANLLTEQLGSPMTIVHSRFGLSSGKTGQILSITTDWIAQRVQIEVLI